MKYAYIIDHGTHRQTVVWDKDPEWVIGFYNAFKGMAVIDWKELPKQKVEEPKKLSCGCTLSYMCEKHRKEHFNYYKEANTEFHVLKGSIGTYVYLDRRWLSPGDIIYYQNEPITIISCENIVHDKLSHMYLYYIDKSMTFKPGDTLIAKEHPCTKVYKNPRSLIVKPI